MIRFHLYPSLSETNHNKLHARIVLDAQERYNRLKTQTQENIDKLQAALTSHKQLEADITKVESWVKNATQTCSKDLHLDASVDQLSDQLKKYRNLANTASTHKVAVGEFAEAAEQMKPELTDADYVQLKESQATLKETFER